MHLKQQTVTRKRKDGTKFRTKSRTWTMYWTDPDTGEKHSKTTGTRDKSVAKQIAAETLRQHTLQRHGIVHQPVVANMPFVDLRKKYIDHVTKTKRAKTAQTYDLNLARFEEACKPHFVRDITTSMLIEFAGLRAGSVKNETVNKELRGVRAMLNWAEECRFIMRAPSFKKVFLPENRKKPIVIRDFTKVLAKALKKVKPEVHSTDWWRVMLTLAHSLGARRGELLGLTWERVCLDRAELTVSSESSKGRRDRTLPLTAALVKLLRKWQKSVPHGPTDPVLPHEKDVRSIYKDLDKLSEAAGVKIGPQKLRSTCGSELTESGIPINVVQDVLGHRCVTTTQRYYANTQAALRPALEKRAKGA